MGTLVVNLYGGPGCGKSTTMAQVFAELKWAGVNCEMAPEFAKEKVWEGSLPVLANQVYIFAKQYHRIHRLLNKVDVIITDSPLLLSLIYGKDISPEFRQFVLAENDKLRPMNFLLCREKHYNPAGRLQTELEARDIDNVVSQLLLDVGEPFTPVQGNHTGVSQIVNELKYKLGIA